MGTLNPGMLYVFAGVDSVSLIFQRVGGDISAKKARYNIHDHFSLNSC